MQATSNGHATVETVARVYQYGTVPPRVAPVRGEEEAAAQLKLANRLWNLLTAIDRQRVRRYRTLMHDEAQEAIDGLRAQLDDLRARIRERRKAARKRSADTELLEATARDVRAGIKTLVEQQKATSKQRHDARRRELAALAETTKRRIKRARQAAASTGLFWGSYNDIVQRADIARKAGEPKFRRFTGDGTLTAQIIGGVATAGAVEGAHTFFQIDPPREGVKWRYARMRIGSDGERYPVWLEIPIVYHRPIPPEALIKSVSMTRRDGVWSLNVTVTLPAAPLKAGVFAASVDIGWRLVPGGIRVAYLLDSGGKHGQIVLPQRDIEGFEQVRRLRSHCDTKLNEFLPALAAWFAGRTLEGKEWDGRVAHLAQWRSGDRLTRLIRWWADHRLPEDGEMFAAAAEWRRNYLHLANWRRNLEDKLRRRVRERYRLIAARLAANHSRIYLEKFDLRGVAKRAQPEEQGEKAWGAWYRTIVSPSVLRAVIVNACRREGVRIVEVDAALSTRECHLCGCAAKWDAAEAVSHTCTGCGARWDQDHNAAIHLMRRGTLLARGAPAERQNAGQTERKWDKVRRLSQEAAQTSENAAGMV